MGSLAWSALGAEAADNELAFAHDAFAEGGCGRGGDGVPLDVFDLAAAVADEVVVLVVPGVVAGGAAFSGDLAHETGLDEVAEVVVGGGAGGAWVDAVDGLEDFGRGGVIVVRQQERHDAVALRGETQAAVLKSLPDLLRVHRGLDYV